VFLAVLVAAVAAASPVTAGEKTVASYCSPSGDICYGIFNRVGKVQLRITTAAHYFGRYGLCVVLLRRGPDPQHALRCGSFPLFNRGGGIWGSTVRYARQYPVTLPGGIALRGDPQLARSGRRFSSDFPCAGSPA
jgi:hypothetical protein